MRRFKNADIVCTVQRPRTEWRKPLPFPGQYPTKIGFVFMARGGGKVVRYFGVPSFNAAAQFRKYLMKRGFIWGVEMDRGGPLVAWNAVVPYGDQETIFDWNEHLYRFYHPWDHRDVRMITKFMQPFSVKRIKFNNQIHQVYALTRDKLKQQTHLAPFKQWLTENREGLQL